MKFLTNDKLVIVGAGGAIGSNKNFDPTTGAFEIDQLHPLVDDATSLWHWAKWLTGWTSITAATDCVFGN